MSGTRANRPGLGEVPETLRAGDILAVRTLDRLGRSVKRRVDLAGELHKRGVQLKSLTDFIYTGTPSGRFFFLVMASLAEMEREPIIERLRAGLDVARLLGRKTHSGSTRTVCVRRWLAPGVSVTTSGPALQASMQK